MLIIVIVFGVMLYLLTALMLIQMRELYWRGAQLTWEHERMVFVADVFQAVNAVKHHKFTKGRPYEGRFGANGPGGFTALVWESDDGLQTELNYQTLADMVIIEHEQQALIVVALDHLRLYELEHPQPNPPTYFGKRIRMPLS